MKEFYVVLVTLALINCISLSRLTGPATWSGRPGQWHPSASDPGVVTVFVLSLTALLVANTLFTAGTLTLAAQITELRTAPLLIVVSGSISAALMLLPLSTWIRRRYPLPYRRLRLLLPVVGVESVILTSLLILALPDFGVGVTLLWSLCAGIGMVLMITIFGGLRLRLTVSDVPGPWRGLPLELVTAGILALALLSPVGVIP